MAARIDDRDVHTVRTPEALDKRTPHAARHRRRPLRGFKADHSANMLSTVGEIVGDHPGSDACAQ